MTEENHVTLTSEEWDNFMLFLTPNTRRNLETSCGIRVKRRQSNVRELTYLKSSTRENLLIWIEEILPVTDQIHETLPVCDDLIEIFVERPRPRKRSADRKSVV